MGGKVVNNDELLKRSEPYRGLNCPSVNRIRYDGPCPTYADGEYFAATKAEKMFTICLKRRVSMVRTYTKL